MSETQTKMIDLWNFYMKDITSPQSFIDIGFYYMIAAALQRRVWIPSRPHIYPNPYYVLVAPAGVGKGLVLTQVKDFLTHHPLREPTHELRNGETVDDSSSLMGAKYKKEDNKIPLLFPIAPEAFGSYQALLHLHAKSVRHIKTYSVGENPGEKKLVLYAHCSLAFCLQELSSLFKKHMDDVTKYLLCAWDCVDYTYNVLSRGEDEVKTPCLSILAGTTPRFMKESADDKILDDGLASRIFFVYESSNRFHRFEPSDFSSEQKEARKTILAHLKKLSVLYGPCNFTPDAHAFLKHYIEEVLPYKRENLNVKLETYYARKNLHLQKLVTAIHYADKTDNLITLDECEQALNFANKLEVKMHYALSFGSKNPTSDNAKKIIAYIRRKKCPATYRELFMEFMDEIDVSGTALQDALIFAQEIEQIELYSEGNVKFYRIKEKQQHVS